MSKPAPSMIKVTSSNIESIGYQDLDLYVKFHNGTVYKHTNVEPSLFQGFRETDSPGKFYAGRVKGKYASEKVEIEEPDAFKEEKKADDPDQAKTENLQQDLGTGQSADGEGNKPQEELKDVGENQPGTGTLYRGPTDAEKLQAEQEKKAQEDADAPKGEFKDPARIEDDNGKAHPVTAAEDAQLSDDIRKAFSELSDTDDSHWNEAGEPDLNVLSDKLNRRVTREQVDAATTSARRPAITGTQTA